MIARVWNSLLRTIRFISEHPLTRDRRGAALLRYVTWQARRRCIRQPKVIGFVNGSRLQIPPGAHGLTGFYYVGLPDFEDTAFALHLVRAGEIFADVGANAGAGSVAAAAVGARVHAFEPVPATFQLLEKNAALNCPEASIEGHAAGVGRERGTLRFTTEHGAGNHVASTEDLRAGLPTVEVPVVTLDDVFPDTCPTVMKIDVEGWELEVIKGMTNLLGRPELRGLVIETFRHTNLHTPKLQELEALLARHGFTPVTYHPFARRLDDGQSHERPSDNTIYARDTNEVRDRLRLAPPFCILGQRI